MNILLRIVYIIVGLALVFPTVFFISASIGVAFSGQPTTMAPYLLVFFLSPFIFGLIYLLIGLNVLAKNSLLDFSLFFIIALTFLYFILNPFTGGYIGLILLGPGLIIIPIIVLLIFLAFFIIGVIISIKQKFAKN